MMTSDEEVIQTLNDARGIYFIRRDVIGKKIFLIKEVNEDDMDATYWECRFGSVVDGGVEMQRKTEYIWSVYHLLKDSKEVEDERMIDMVRKCMNAIIRSERYLNT